MSQPKRPFPSVGPGDHVTFIDVTPADRERIRQACHDLYGWLKERTDGPAEALTVMSILTDAIKDSLGIKHHSLVTSSDGGSLQ